MGTQGDVTCSLAGTELSLPWGEKAETKGHNTRREKSGNYGRDTSHANRWGGSNHTETCHPDFVEEVAFELRLGR